VALFRKKETYNEQMLREAGLDRVVFNTPEPEAEPPQPNPAFDWSGPTLQGRLGPKDWDIATTAIAPGIAGDNVSFTTLENGDVIVVEEAGDGDLSPLADAIEQHLSPPYTAVGARQDSDLWGVGAKQIEVAEVAFPDAESLVLSQSDGVAEFRVDGSSSDASVPVELQRLGERAGGDFCVEAQRIDADVWAVKVSPL
jgi:hypothetical protein